MDEEEILFEIDDKTGKLHAASREEFEAAKNKGAYSTSFSVGMEIASESRSVHPEKRIPMSEKIFDQVLGLSGSVRRSLIRIIENGVNEGERLNDINKKVEELLRDQHFQWPDYDRWHRVFADQKFWPEMWETTLRIDDAHVAEQISFERKGPKYEQDKFQAKIFLLTHTLVSQAYSHERLRSFESMAVTQFEILGSDDNDCRLCAGERGRIYPISEVTKYPPFHPGCRCVCIPRTRS